jgi:ATP-dependent Clp protease ATP-binding subunit ClpA
MIGELRSALEEKKINLSCTEAALRLIAKKSYSRKFGARNMRRFIQKEIEDRLANMIIADYRHFYSFVKLDADGEEIAINCM